MDNMLGDIKLMANVHEAFNKPLTLIYIICAVFNL